MTYEEMLAVAGKVADALTMTGMDDVNVEPPDPGKPIPIMFGFDGELFVLELMPA